MKQHTAAPAATYYRASLPEVTVEVSGNQPRAVIYLRVSTDKQVNKALDPEGYSLPAQREACYRKAEALGAEVVDEYVDYGETAKFADRPEFQRLVERVREQRDVDFVIVHKLNRFARNRRDDANFLYDLHMAGAKLVSVSENIDDSPSGRLLHGIMASIAEYESANLATEALKGMTRKAQSGGTSGTAPLGYLNREVIINGRRVRSVVIDEERAPLIRWAFEQYATGEWSLVDLTELLDQAGLRSRPSKNHDGLPLGPSRLNELLKNRYYIGYVRFRGVEYKGVHEHLIDDDLFEQVQLVLALHVNGEKRRTHPHYLKSTVICGICGSRLCVTYAKQQYLYFFCIGRQKRRSPCRQPYVNAEALEEAVCAFYRRIQLTPGRIEALRAGLVQELKELRTKQTSEAERQTKRLTKLSAERTKLLHAHLADAVPLDLLKTEQERLARETREAEQVLKASQIKVEAVAATVDIALELAADCEAMYRSASPKVRRMFNRVFFEHLVVIDDRVVAGNLKQPFAALLAHDTATAIETAEKESEENPGLLYARGSRDNVLAPPTGFEPVLPP